MVPQHILPAVKSSIEKHPAIIFAYLFGSSAQDASGPLSDIDIAVFLESSMQKTFLDTKLNLYADCSRALKRNDIDIVILNTAQNIILLDEITRTGTVLIDKDTDLRIGFEQKIMHQAIDFKTQRMAIMGI